MALVPLLMLVGAIMLLVVSSASGAFGTPQIDELGPNDAPGQKDLTSQATDTAGLPSVLGTQWNWDDLKTNGGNTLDACSLLDTDDADDFANYAVCGTTRGSTDNYAGTTTLYSCGNTRVDRCSSQIAVVTPTHGTTCTFALSATDPFGPPDYTGKGNVGNEFPNDTRATCTIYLDDFNVNINTLVLINTCSYPSQQPNSDPSDCVLIPGLATPNVATTPTLIPQDSATVAGNVSGSVTFELYLDSTTSGTPGVCDLGELVFQKTDISGSPFTTENAGGNTLTAYTITTAGTYLWKVNYSGDSANNPAESQCGAEKFVITTIQSDN